MASSEKTTVESDTNFLNKIFNREIHGSDRCHRKARPQRLFKKIPKRLCYRLSSLIPAAVLEAEGYVFLGFTKCGQFVVSYTCQMDAEERTGLPYYMYKLQWWWFVPNRPLVKVSEVQLFGEQEILCDLYILFCEWPEDRTQVVVFGHSFPGREQESCQCYLTVTAIPSLAPCRACSDLHTGADERALCLKHSFCLHTKYELTPPFPVFFPRVQLKCNGQVILNTGDSIVSLHVDMDGIDSKPKGPFNDSSVLKVKESLVTDKNKETVCTSPEPNKEFVWSAGALNIVPLTLESPTSDPQPTSSKSEPAENVDPTWTSRLDTESQKENTSYNAQDMKLERIKSPPKSPKSNLSQNQKSVVSASEKWFEGINLPQLNSAGSQSVSSQMPSPRRVRTPSSEIHTKDLYNFDSDDSEDNSYSFMCPTSVPKVTLKAKSPSGPDLHTHPHNLVISPSVHIQRQLAFGVSKTSPLLNNSQALNCLSVGESPKLTFEQVLSNRGILNVQRSFFSPSNSENSYGGTSSSADSVIVQVNDARTITHSWRKFSYHGDTAVDSTLVIEDDFDLSYRSVLPAEVRGTKNRPLCLSLDPSNDGNKEQLCVKQLTFDIEHYMEEAIRSSAPWEHRYIAFTNYDLQILDVYMDRNEVLAKVFALISAKEETKQKKIYKRKGQEKLYQTSFTFEVNIQSGVYETLEIEDLTLVDEKDLRGREWKPGFRECAMLRRHVFVPQSAKRSVHVLSNEAVFKGKSLQMILFPEHYTALVL
ncbi:DDB1- and CUL4-associated factor 15-like [Mya arenaria]|uniref:DDB1- and CUL4-associated factor 15-like n=1 Tax=Mya arenaria TaxID=6604 RepID=UPI0022E76E52|nr:DDB1- and CUL4-associated factor 15-like [Mya arenaria]